MPAYRSGGAGRYRKWVGLRDGRRVRISGTPAIDTKGAAEAAEHAHILRVLDPRFDWDQRNQESQGTEKPEKKEEIPTFEEFAADFLVVCEAKNKLSEVDSKEMILRVHLTPFFGKLRLDEITYAKIQDYTARKATRPGKGRKKPLAKKSVNNHLTVLRRLLVVAKKRGLIAVVPEIEWLQAPKPAFDFLTFEEADRLVAGADGEWATMILVGLRTGLRQGELLALRWQDVDLKSGLLCVRQSVTRGRVTVPKSGKGREVALGDGVLAALKGQRHLRGELVFCTSSGRMLRRAECRRPLMYACRKAGLRQVGWHVLRHTFASHLAMRGVPLKAVQELLGHATIEMTMRYSHLSPHVAREAVKLLDGTLGNGWAKAGVIERN